MHQKRVNVYGMCWVKMYIIYRYENVFDNLLNKVNQKLFIVNWSDILGHHVCNYVFVPSKCVNLES